MVFRRKKFSTAEEILDLVKTDNEIMHSTAVIYFYRSDKVSGKLYLRQGADAGLVYAAHVSDMPFEIGKRLKQYIDIDEYNDIIRQVGGDETDPNIARLVVARQLVSEKVVDAYIREYLFDAATEIFSWTEVISKWEVGTETRDFASKQHIRLELLQQRAKERSAQYHSMILDTKLTEDQVSQLKVLRKGSEKELASIKNQNLLTIINAANGKNTISDIRQVTGMLKVPAFMGIYSLWKAGLVQLVAGDVPVYPPVDVEPEVEEEAPIEHVEAIPLEEYDSPETVKIDSTEDTDDEDDAFIVGETVQEESDVSPVESKNSAIIIEPIVEVEKLEEDEQIKQDDENDFPEGSESEDNVKTELEELLATFAQDPSNDETEKVEVLSEPIHDMNDDETLFPIHAKMPLIEEKIVPTNKPAEAKHKKSTTIQEEPMTQSSNSSLSILDKLNNRISDLQQKVDSSESEIKLDDIEIKKAEIEVEEIEAKLTASLERKKELVENRKMHLQESKHAQEKLDAMLVTIDNLVG